jgi:drug/metabolite transporter (DMT)-like permease
MAAAAASAIAIGTVDFLAGVMGRRDEHGSGMLVVFSAVCAGATVIALISQGVPDTAGLGWGALQGAMMPVAFLSLMRGISEGHVVVVVPVTGLLTVLVPVAVDLAGGARPSAVLWAGIALGACALVLIGIGRETGSRKRSAAWSAAMGSIAGVLTGVGFVVLDHASFGGHWYLAANSVTAAVVTVVVLAASGRLRLPSISVVRPALALTALWIAGFSLLLFAFERGSLTLVTVVASQYPAVTLLLTAAVWRQRPRGVQYLGVAASLAALGLISVGV